MISANKDISKLQPQLQKFCKELIKISKAQGIYIFVTEGLRTLERQKQLYAQGRTKPGKKVTWTLQSKHLDGSAFDIAFEPKHHGELYPSDNGLRERVGQLGESLGLIWGGRWKVQDKPHFELSSKSTSPTYPKKTGTTFRDGLIGILFKEVQAFDEKSNLQQPGMSIDMGQGQEVIVGEAARSSTKTDSTYE